LEPETESAIADYILNGRPKCNLPYIFLRHNAPHNALSQQSVTVLFTRYKTRAGIASIPNDGKSFHGLRRSIARWMLESEIPLTTISQFLGHRDLDSAVPYLSFDEDKLRLCGLSLAGIEVTKEGLI
jgi:integrase